VHPWPLDLKTIGRLSLFLPHGACMRVETLAEYAGSIGLTGGWRWSTVRVGEVAAGSQVVRGGPVAGTALEASASAGSAASLPTGGAPR
jgi:hypothetical protein